MRLNEILTPQVLCFLKVSSMSSVEQSDLPIAIIPLLHCNFLILLWEGALNQPLFQTICIYSLLTCFRCSMCVITEYSSFGQETTNADHYPLGTCSRNLLHLSHTASSSLLENWLLCAYQNMIFIKRLTIMLKVGLFRQFCSQQSWIRAVKPAGQVRGIFGRNP